VPGETDRGRAAGLAGELEAELARLPRQDTAALRAVRRAWSGRLRSADAAMVLDVALALATAGRYRWIGYELVRNHRPAFERLDGDWLERLGEAIDSWWTVDAFARTLSGPAWLAGLVSDEQVEGWAHSPDRWWRRAALVSTVALNMRSQGGRGDVPRTLALCRLLATDHDDMVAKALSWALRELVVHDPEAVQGFLDTHGPDLAARVRREVTNKLRTGLKSPGRRAEDRAAGGGPLGTTA
jgi:3-methyladenine DNA glycosylase AlkD